MRVTRARIVLLCAVFILAAGGATAYVLHAYSAQQEVARHQPRLPTVALAKVQSVPHIVFRNTALGSRYGMVAMVTLADPGGPRAVTTTSCERVYATPRDTLCVTADRGVVTKYSASVLDSRTFATIRRLPLEGTPSRARLSPDGTLGATTTFVSGDSYASVSFSTRTRISPASGSGSEQLESFTLVHDGRTIAPTDRNYWGVTFAGDDTTFYATVEWAQHTWLVRGNLRTKRVVTLHEDAECPSLSPDGRAIVFKQRGTLPIGRWRLVRYDIASGTVTPLAETRSVDDQVEWLDNSTVIYGLARTGSQAAIDDVWAVPADGSGRPRLLIPQAWSPAVVR